LPGECLAPYLVGYLVIPRDDLSAFCCTDSSGALYCHASLHSFPGLLFRRLWELHGYLVRGALQERDDVLQFFQGVLEGEISDA
jgi:hypothetical protein